MEFAQIQSAQQVNFGMEVNAKLLTVLHHHTFWKTDVSMEEIKIAILDITGMETLVTFILLHAQVDQYGAILYAKTINVGMDFILGGPEIVSLFLRDALQHINGMDQNVLLKEIPAQKAPSYKEITACQSHHVKMDLYGIQFILDVFALLAQSIMEIDVYNVQMIKSGFQV